MKATSSRPLLNTWKNCVRACSISVALSFCFLAPCSARADQAADVAAILQLLQSSFLSPRDALATVDYSANLAGAFPSASFLYRGLGEGWSYNSANPDTSYLYMIQRALYGQSGSPSQSQSLLPVLWRVEALLRALSASTNDVEYLHDIDSKLYYVRQDQVNALNLLGQSYGVQSSMFDRLGYLLPLRDYYTAGDHPNAWDVALVPDQLDEFRQMLQALEYTSGTSGETIVGAIEDATRTNAAIAGDLHALRLGLLDEYDTLDTVEEHVDTVSEYVDEDIETNALAALTITPGDAGDLSPVLDLVDPDSFDVLPSLSGGDPVVQVFTASRDSNLPAFSIDFSLPSGFRTFVHAVCVWIWRMLFFLAMWRLVNEEYGYWSTLGGSAG